MRRTKAVREALQVLSGMRYPMERIYHILRRKDIMLESPVYRDILEEGKAMGLELGCWRCHKMPA